MKTPREILLEHHRTAKPKLDAIRNSITAELNNKETREQSFPFFFVSSLLGCSNKLWLELVLPCRRVWSGLAAVWILIIAVNLAEHEPAPAGKISAAPAMMSLGEQQRLLNELFADRSPANDADRQKNFSPKPRTEKFQTFAA